MNNPICSWLPATRVAIPSATSGNFQKFRCRLAVACAAVIALTSLSAGAADYSNWLKNLSAAGDPTALYSHTKVKVATSGNYVHVAWFASLIASPYSCAIFYTRSTDGGQTFETPRILVFVAGNQNITFDATFNNLAADGAYVHLVYRDATSWPQKLQYLRSTDNGATFAAARTLSEGVTPSGSYFCNSAYLTAGNGKLAVVWSYKWNGGGGYGAFNSSYSSDNGASFTTTTIPNTLYSFGIEDAVRSGDYVYVLTSAGDGNGGYGYTGRLNLWASWDGGATFKPQVQVTVPTTESTPRDRICNTQSGIYSPNLVASGSTVNVAWINQDTYVNDYNKTYTLRTCRSTDGGQTLNAPVTLHSFAAGDGSAVNAGMETISGNGSNLYITTVLNDAPAGTYTWRSTDAGATWGAARQISSSGTLPITKADPSDATRVHTVNSFYYQSNDSGATFDGGVNPHTPIGDWSLPQMAIDDTGVVHYAANSGYYGEIFYRRLAAPPQPGTTNKALSCVGNATNGYLSDNMQVAASPDLNFTNNMTVECWVRRDTDDTNAGYFQPIVTRKYGSYGSYAIGAWSASQIYARVLTEQAAGGVVFVASGVSMDKGVWYHVALTYDASLDTDNVKLFVNGVQHGQANAKGAILFNKLDAPIQIGNNNTSGARPGGFSIDELRLWNKPLAGSDIAAGMNYTRSGTEDGLVAYYDFNDTTMDITGRGNDGILMFRETYTASAAPVTVAPMVNITSPYPADSFASGATIPLVAGLDNSGGVTVTGVDFYDYGTFIGHGQLSAFGRWIFPDTSELAVMGDSVMGMVDYAPPGAYSGGEQMYMMDGTFPTQNSFQGWFTHYIGPDPVTGNATIQFSLTSNGTLDASMLGDAPLGTRNLTGGVNQHLPQYTFSWSGAVVGAHSITARAYYQSGNSTTYAPSASVNITVTDAATRVIGLSGNLTFGNVKVGSSANGTMTVSNTGNSPLAVSSISYPAGFTGNWESGTIAAGTSQDVTVTFTPSAAQTYNGTITVSSDSTSGTNTIAASGQGTQTPFEAWQASNFTAADVATGRTIPSADFEGDGMSNLLEYAFAKNPKLADLTGIAPNVSSNKMQISFRCDASCTDISYTVQVSSNLSTWTDIAKSTGGATTLPIGALSTVSDTGTGVRTVTVTDAATLGGKRFLRVKITTP